MDPLYSVDPDIRAYALGINSVEGSQWHPRQSFVRCLNCGERAAIGGAWCEACEAPDPHEAYERRAAERARSIWLGRERTAAMLERMGFADRAAIHRGER